MIIPASGQAGVSFQLMMTSGDYTDIIVNEPGYNGGGDKAIEDGVYLRLNDMVEEYAPNYAYYLANYPDFRKSTITDIGNCSHSTASRRATWNRLLQAPGGALVRKTGRIVGLSIPVTVDDLYGILKAFKDNGFCENPLLLDKSGVFVFSDILTAFGTEYSSYPGMEFYQVDNKVKFGFLEPGFKEYLTLMNKWYKEELIDQNFASRTESDWPLPLLAQDKGGVSSVGYGYAGDALYGQTKQSSNPEFYLQAVTQPVLNKGDTTHFGYKSQLAQSRTVITTACKTPDIAMKYLDFYYTPQGGILTNYGVEGISYNLDESGNPLFTDLILKSTDLPPAFKKIQHASFAAPGLQEITHARQFTSESAMGSMDVWSKNNADWAMPLNLTMTADEGAEYSNIMSDINTLVTEMTAKFIMGVEPLEKYDEFVSLLKSMDIERAMEIKQASLDRYNNR